MALGMLVVLLVTITAISVIGLSLLYLMKGEKASRIVFYTMAIWGMAIAALTAGSLPINYTVDRLLAWAIGFLSVAGILVYIRKAKDSSDLAARLLVTASVVIGTIRLFLI